MTSISQSQTVDLADIGLNAPATKKDEADDSKFLQLFVAQLRNQNPLEPQEGAEFLSQLAQFSTVEGIDKMEKAMTNLSERFGSAAALQASTLVGKNVHVPTSEGIFAQGQAVSGAIDVPQAVTDLNLEVYSASGELVKTYSINSADAGELDFTWNGLDDNDQALPAGVYSFKASATINGELQQLNTFIAANVNSVSINNSGQPVTLNVTGYGKVSLDEIRTIS